MLVSISLLLLILMGKLTCEGCKSTLQMQSGYQHHIQHCDEYTVWLHQRAAKREAKKLKQNEAKIQQLHAVPPEEKREQLWEALNEVHSVYCISRHCITRQVQTFELTHAEGSRQAEEPPELPSTYSGRKQRAPRALKDYVPSSTAGRLTEHVSQLVPPPSTNPSASDTLQPSNNDLPNLQPETEGSVNTRKVLETEPNGFSVFRRYFTFPDKDTESQDTTDPLCNSLSITTPSPDTANVSGPTHGFGHAAVAAATSTVCQWFASFLNATVFCLMHWAYTGSNLKSTSEINRCVTPAGGWLRTEMWISVEVGEKTEFSRCKGMRVRQ